MQLLAQQKRVTFHESLWEDGAGRERRKGGTVCQSEMSDMWLSSSTWQGLEWPWLSGSDSSKGRMKDRQERSRVEKG